MRFGMLLSIQRLLHRFYADTRGTILIITGLSFLFLVAVGGAGYDLGRQRLITLKLQQAADAASLAASGMTFGVSTTQRQDMANTMFSLNYPDSYLGVDRPTPAINVGVNTVTVSASAEYDTMFVQAIDIETLDSDVRSVAQIKRDKAKLDVILTMDNSGSMRAADVGAVAFLNADIPSASAACRPEMYSPAQSAYLLANWPIPAAPNPLYVPAMRAWCDNPNAVSYRSLGTTAFGLTGSTRLNAVRFAANSMADYLFNVDPYDHRVALVKWDNIVISSDNFSNNYSTVRASLLNMYSGVDTRSSVGLRKAKDIGTAGFRSDAVHAVILLTDGVNSFGPAYNITAENADSLAVCREIKAIPNTIVYTIVFGRDSTNATVRQFLSDCATGPNGPTAPNEGTYFFAAPNAASLNKAFEAIIGNLKKVRILE